jgi:hypothetical protein
MEHRDSEKSSRRERLVEHMFVGDLMRTLWRHQLADDLDVLRPETDASGYDLVLELGEFVRHVQLKASSCDAHTARQTVQLSLGRRPSGCVLWVQFDPATMELGPFLFFGGRAGKPLPDVSDFPIAKHTRGNAQGRKGERKNVRVIKKSQFRKLDNIVEVANALFNLSLKQ